ncbi:MAG: sigma-70 family RNA polymerase sigma factor [Candidatus Pacebacteria bacterium]|nr:sigma-70 family RNA polymerase sigma factor [Candidatus Paceibacterota bacterium]
MAELSDKHLAERYLKGEEGALEVLIKRYLKPIYGFVYKNVGDGEAAEDITQEVFVKVWKNLKKFDRQKSFKSWIFTIAKNASIDFLRRRRTVPLSTVEEFLSEKSDFAGEIERKSIADGFKKTMKSLSPGYRAVILLKHEAGLSFREISGELGEPLNTVKSRYRRALAALKKLSANF